MMIFSFFIYLFSSVRKKRIYRHLGRTYAISPWRVCALANGSRPYYTKEYLIAAELVKRRLLE